MLVVHLGHERPAAAGQDAQGRRWRSTPTSSSPSRRAASCASSTPARSARCSSPTPDDARRGGPRARRTSASTRSTTPMSWDQFGDLLAPTHAKLKPLLMDQKFVAGIGNIYSDEILWAAGLRCDRMSDSLSPQEVRRLYRAMVEIAAGRDQAPRLVAGRRAVRRPVRQARASTSTHHKVYDREGQACRRCRQPIVARARRRPLDVLLRGLPGVTPRCDVARDQRPPCTSWSRGACRACGSATSCRRAGASPRV